MRTMRVISAAIVLLVVAGRCDSERSSQVFQSLNGACIRLLAPIVVMQPTTADELARPYLDITVGKIDKLVAVLSPGARIYVVRVIYKESFEHEVVTPLTRVPGVTGEVESTLLFSSAWHAEARAIERRGHGMVSGNMRSRALDGQLAEWCSDDQNMGTQKDR